MHFTWGRRGFRLAVPDAVPRATGLSKDQIVLWSGAVELGLAAALAGAGAGARTGGSASALRRVGTMVAVFFVAVFPGNIHHWRSGRSVPGLDTDAKRFGRLFLQPVLVAWALWSTRGSARC
ncbi:hypothetical protein ABXJ56_05775 [Microbacterium chocolatum]